MTIIITTMNKIRKLAVSQNKNASVNKEDVEVNHVVAKKKYNLNLVYRLKWNQKNSKKLKKLNKKIK